MKRIVILKEKEGIFILGLYCEIYSGQFFRELFTRKEESIKVEFGLKRKYFR